MTEGMTGTLYRGLFTALALAVSSYFLQACGEQYECPLKKGPTLSYNDSTHMCCNGRIINHQSGRFVCHTFSDTSQRWYDIEKERVCNDIFYNVEDKEMRCAWGSGPYNSTTHIDCSGNIHSLEEGDACCGTNIMNSSSEVCCTVDLTGMKTPLSPEECCNSSTTEARNLHCCAGSLFDPDEKMCCQQELFNKTGVHRCSKDPTFPRYDIRTHLELQEVDKVIEIVDGKNTDCGNVAHNPNNSFCSSRSVESKVIRIDSKSGSMCGLVPYNKENSTCCQGNITEGVPEIEGIVRCNGEEAVFTSTHLLCSGTVYPRSETIDEACCAADVYRTDTQICCEGNVYNKTSPSSDCCGKSMYDRASQLCYNSYLPYINKIVNGTTDKSKVCAGKLLGHNEICIWDMIGEKVLSISEDVDSVCGVMGYKEDEYFCDRDGFLVPRGPDEGLCNMPRGDVLFDTTKSICCDGELLPRLSSCGKERGCCNEQVFVPEFETCSAATGIWKVPSHFAGYCGAGIFDNRTHVCDSYNLIVEKDEYDRKPSVCIDKNDIPIRYNQSDHFCCGRQLWPVGDFEEPDCCYNKPFDNASLDHICCEGWLINTGGVPMTCDGPVAYSQEQQVCGGVVHNKSDGSCCGSGVYDPQTELCCEDTVKITKSSATEQCCGLSKFDSADSTLICCGNSTLHENVPGYECCASSLMNPEESICLNEEYILSRDYEDKTCDASIVEHNAGTCCAGILHVGKFGSCDGLYFVGRDDDQLWCGQNLLKHGEACCGGILYDKENHTCVNDSSVVPVCNGVTFDRSSQSCCDQEIINKGEKICCDGHIRNVTNGEDRCCGTAAYNSEEKFCCREKLKDMKTSTPDDLKECCPRNHQYNLLTRSCQKTGCSVCPEYERLDEEIAQAAKNSSQQTVIKVIRFSRGEREVSVRVFDSPRIRKKCPNYQQGFQGWEINLVLPEGCSCNMISGNRYILLSSQTMNGDQWFLSDADVILERSKLSRAIRSIDCET